MNRSLRLAARFVCCAIPGAALLLIVGPGFLIEAIERGKVLGYLVALIAISAGAALILYGTDRWGKWGYLLPVLAVLPFVFAFDRPVPGVVLLALLLFPLFVALGVHRYYA